MWISPFSETCYLAYRNPLRHPGYEDIRDCPANALLTSMCSRSAKVIRGWLVGPSELELISMSMSTTIAGASGTMLRFMDLDGVR